MDKKTIDKASGNSCIPFLPSFFHSDCPIFTIIDVQAFKLLKVTKRSSFLLQDLTLRGQKPDASHLPMEEDKENASAGVSVADLIAEGWAGFRSVNYTLYCAIVSITKICSTQCF